MAVSEIEFKEWIEVAKQKGATHMISVCDTFDYDDYPVCVMPTDNLEDVKKRYDNVNMQRINEVVELKK